MADEELTRAKALREDEQSLDAHLQPSRAVPQRSPSASSSGSAATISTSRSKSPVRARRPILENFADRSTPQEDRLPLDSPPHKRKRREVSDSSVSRSPPRFDSPNKSRRYRSSTPENRGRQRNDRRGSNRSRSRGSSVDQSEVARHRRSLEPISNRRGRDLDASTQKQNLNRSRETRDDEPRPPRRERSLSPYSRRLALTQAMNMGR